MIQLKYVHMGEGSGRGSGRVRFFVGNRGSGRVGSTSRRVGSGRVQESDPWTTLIYHRAYDYLSASFGVLWVHMAWHKNCVKNKYWLNQ